MVATLLSLLAALALIAGKNMIPGFGANLVFPDILFIVFFMVTLFCSLLPWLWTLFSTSGTKNTPVTLAPLRSCVWDKQMYVYSIGIQILSLLGIVIASQEFVPPEYVLGLCLIYVGGILDLLRKAFFRLQYRRTASGVAEWFIESMKEAVRKRDVKLQATTFEMVFSTIVDYLHCGLLGSLKIFCDKLSTETDLWIGAIAGLQVYKLPSEFEESMLDRYIYAEAKTAKRVSWFAKEACEVGSPIAFEEAVRLTRKLFLAFHSYYETLGFILLVSLSQASQKMKGKLDPVDREIEVTIGFSEVIKALIDRSIEKNSSDVSSILKVLAILEAHVRGIFHKEKTINPAFLMQPFAEIGQMLGSNRYDRLIGRDEILSQLRRILAQFAAIETVSGRFDMETPGTDTKASFREDLPFINRPEKSSESSPKESQ